MNLPRSLVTAALLFAGACATPVELGRPRNVREDSLHEFQLLQQVFRTQYSGSHVFDFEGHGRVTVREISLDGFPGHTYVRCRFHYQNRTPKPVVQSWVSLDVLDADGRVVGTQSCHLVMPTATAIGRGAYYSDELRTPTYDAHLQPGWTWRIRCQSDLEQPEEPLSPPVPEWEPPRQPTPFFIRDPNWPYPPRWWY